MTPVDTPAPVHCPVDNEHKGLWWTDVSIDNRVPSTTIPAEHRPWAELAESTGSIEKNESAEKQFLSPAVRSWNDERWGVKYSSMNDFTSFTEIYRGRLSVVWHAVCGATAEQVVVKAYPKVYLQDRHLLNVRKEIAFLTKFNTDGFDGIVSLLGVFEDVQNVCIVTEYCHGQDLLHQMDKSGGTMSERDVCRKVVYPLLKILDRLHKQGIVHRDLKAENVFFTKDGSLKLGDFGLALDTSREIATTKVGTLDYMAPEVLRTPSPDELKKLDNGMGKLGCYNEKVDIWSLGILAYELIVGKPPFEVEDMQETMKLILWSPVEKFPQSMSVFCQHFINKALEKDSSVRPSAEKLLQHPWICQNVGIRALAPLSATATPRCESITSKQQRGISSPPTSRPCTAKLAKQTSSRSAGAPRSPTCRPKTCIPRLGGSGEISNASKSDSVSETKSALWSSTGGPARLYGVGSSAPKKDFERSGRFKFDPRSLTSRGHSWVNSRFAKKKPDGESESAKLCGENSFSGKSMKDRIKHLLPKKLRSNRSPI
ncbi:hypothetical protein BSKO_05322 [Bryopsis sp. KO-2023]|nr:hypothetical protein BSKO_05322 [Bryopsis sp. KO-2023]